MIPAVALLLKVLAFGLADMIQAGLLAVPLVWLLRFPDAVAGSGLACFAGAVPLALCLRSGALVALGLLAIFACVGAASEA